MPKMKKKMLAVLAGLMILAMGTMTVAAASPETNTADGDSTAAVVAAEELASQVGEVKSDAGEVVKTTVSDEVATAVSTSEGLATIATAADSTLAGKKLTAVAAVDIDIPGIDWTQYPNGVKVDIAVKGVVASKSYIVLHQKADGSWERLDAEVKDGVITATFKGSFSPVVIAEVEGDGSAAAGTSSPKTGETAPLATVLAVVMLAGAALCTKKVKFN
jgi:hypothetical protein